MGHKFLWFLFFFLVLNTLKTDKSTTIFVSVAFAENNITSYQSISTHKKINFVVKDRRRTPNPEGWEEYDGSIYNRKRGYGWLTDLAGNGWDRGDSAIILLADGTKTSPQDMDRLELANMHNTHKENHPIIFHVDLPDGWYCLTCTSVGGST